ncbi:MAG: spermidine synthase [Methyloligellaceae bacterium]
MSDYAEHGQAPASSKSSNSLLLISFMSSLFLSAMLLFAIQPMFAKMVLPRLGGAPAVWSVAMCFFQAMLLAGYAYAHGLIRWFGLRKGISIHMVVLFLAITTLPIGIAAGWDSPPETGIRLWVVGLLTFSIGLPFFALSGNGPLLQAWFSRSDHHHANDPYFLYGASNFGSLLALLCYPVLLEPNLRLNEQSMAWSSGFIVLTILVGLSAMLIWNNGRAVQKTQETETKTEDFGWVRRISWVLLAFIPSALLVAVTNHITTDVAAAPFMWIAPLSLYLITFIITFQRKPILSQKLMVLVQPFLIGGLLASILFPISKFWLVFLCIHLLAFFVTAMVCHGRLVELRPKAKDLTEFYLWMSFGGMLGGLFAGLVAPYVFSTVVEYPLLIVLGLLARPGITSLTKMATLRQILIIALSIIAITGIAYLVNYVHQGEVIAKLPAAYIIICALLITAVIGSRQTPLWMAGFLAAAFISGPLLQPNASKKESFRGFFGVNYVSESSDGKYRLLTHGTTLHGAQKIDGASPPEPLTYYHYDSAFADAFKVLRKDRELKTVGIVGLGAGSLACYKRPDELWTFYEIDPLVVQIASDSSRYTFLSDCAPKAPVIIGDARLTLQKDKKLKFDFLVIDAFSSDVVPVHLLTVEALKMYEAKLNENGVLLLHISNRNMNLAPVVSALAKKAGFSGMIGLKEPKKDAGRYKTAAKVAVLAKNAESLKGFQGLEDWSPLPEPSAKVWKDDYSDVLGVILEGLY